MPVAVAFTFFMGVRRMGIDSMASVTKLTTNGRNGWRVRFYVDKKRRELYLAGATKRIADSVGRFCDELAHAKASNVAAGGDAVTWAAGTDSKMRESLVA